MKKRFLPLLGAITIMALSCVTTGGEGKIALSGTGTVTARPDRARFTLTFRQSGATTAEARDRVNGMSEKAAAVLTAEGVKPDDIRTTGISYYEKTRWSDGEEISLGQEAVQTLNVSLPLDDGAENLNRLIDGLTGIDGLGFGGLGFEISRTSSFREEARRLAFEDARVRAEHYAALSGRTLGEVLSLTEQGGYAPPVTGRLLEKAVMDGSGTQVQAGLSEITVVIQVEFGLE